jgi:SAM-dependent methyltransferase
MSHLDATPMTDVSRLARERDFHNRHFLQEDESRGAQNKYYFAIQDGLNLYGQLVLAHAKDRDVLEYGCGTGNLARLIAPRAKTFTGIDLSDVAVSRATEESANAGIQNVKFVAMNAEAMTFDEESFDFVFGSAILHHLDLQRSMSEIHRVLRSGGIALFAEPLGHNPVFNLYRWLTPKRRTDDEHPLKRSDFELMSRLFPHMTIRYFGLLTLLSVPFHSTALGHRVRSGLRRIDDVLIRAGLRWYSWYVLIEVRKG